MRRSFHDVTLRDEESLPYNDAGDEEPEPLMDRDGTFVSQEQHVVSMKQGFSPLISPQTLYAAVKEEEIDRRVMDMKTKESDENEGHGSAKRLGAGTNRQSMGRMSHFVDTSNRKQRDKEVCREELESTFRPRRTCVLERRSAETC